MPKVMTYDDKNISFFIAKEGGGFSFLKVSCCPDG